MFKPKQANVEKLSRLAKELLSKGELEERVIDGIKE